MVFSNEPFSHRFGVGSDHQQLGTSTPDGVQVAPTSTRRRTSVHQLIAVNEDTSPPEHIRDTIARFGSAVAPAEETPARAPGHWPLGIGHWAQGIASPNQRTIVRGDLARCGGAADLIDDLLQFVEVIGHPVGQLRMFC